MKKILMAVLSCSVIVLSGCQGMLPSPPIKDNPLNGYIYSAVDWDGKVANAGVTEDKVGTACAQSFLGMVAYGNASIAAAKLAGSITKVSNVVLFAIKRSVQQYSGFC